MIFFVFFCLIMYLYVVSYVISFIGFVFIFLISMCCSMLGILNSDVIVMYICLMFIWVI